MEAHVPPLVEALRAVPECRSRSGRRHPLVAVLATACAAMLCGARGYSAIADWGRDYAAAHPELGAALGFTHQPLPCAATYFHVLRRLDRAQFEAVLGAWAEAVLAATAPRAATAPIAADDRRGEPEDGVALDGKTLRGSRKQGAPGVHLLSAVSHRLGLTLGQAGVDDKTNEIPVAPALVTGLVIAGRIFTMDALLTQRELAQAIVDGGGDYVMPVKENQPGLYGAIDTLFATPRPLRPTLADGPDPRAGPWAAGTPIAGGQRRLGRLSRLAGGGPGVSDYAPPHAHPHR